MGWANAAARMQAVMNDFDSFATGQLLIRMDSDLDEDGQSLNTGAIGFFQYRGEIVGESDIDSNVTYVIGEVEVLRYTHKSMVGVEQTFRFQTWSEQQTTMDPSFWRALSAAIFDLDEDGAPELVSPLVLENDIYSWSMRVRILLTP